MPCLPFINGISPDRMALLDDRSENWLSYGDLTALAQQYALKLLGQRSLVFLYARNDATTVAAFIGALAAGHAVALFEPELSSDVRAELETTYRPNWIIGPDPGTVSQRDEDAQLHPDLAVLLSTSGSTGSPKLVRLNIGALVTNAEGIADVLDIQSDDVAAGYLPLHYSYGLSVLTSHLQRGARVRLTNRGFTDKAFWAAMREAAVTHMPGVPFHYEIMIKLGLTRLGLPHLRTLTQAGGSLDPRLRHIAHEYMQSVGGRFFILYGQTEAAPRMTTLQHEDFLAAPTSVGKALPGCRIEILNPDQQGRGEVVFYGPNVMMGYAEGRADLVKGDLMSGRLLTGDLGFLDAEERLTLTGRAKRLGKLYGLRINLDEVEALVNSIRAAAVTQTGNVLTIHIVTTGDEINDALALERLQCLLSDRFTIPRTGYRFRSVTEIPRTERGKIDYSALEASI
jgi:acyl-CoA synthetase (AMP-forming)/AMP-acid ligase II